MEDILILSNYLILLKGTTEVYVHGTIESSNESVRTLLNELLNDTLSSQACTYDTMCECGWYQVDNVKTNEIKELYKKVSDK